MKYEILEKIAFQLERIANAMHGELESDADTNKINVKEMNTIDTKV